jgi:hypothetical protein
MHYARLTAQDAIDAGIFDAAELADAQRHLPEPVFRELCYAEPETGWSAVLRAAATCSRREEKKILTNRRPSQTGLRANDALGVADLEA